MKKYLALILGVLFVLSFAASAFAIHAEIPAETQSVVAAGTTQITLGGEIRTRGWWRDNLAGGLSLSTNNQAWYDERVRLSVQADVAPGVIGYVQLEAQSPTDGDKYTWGNGSKSATADVPVGGRGSDGTGGSNSKPNTQLDILQAWIVYSGQGLFGFNSGLKIGHMPLKLAYGQFFDNTQYGDDAIVFFMSPIKGLEIAALTFKSHEGAVQINSDDLDAYVGLVTYKWDDRNTVGINYTLLNSPGAAGPNFDLKMSNLGLHADGSFGALGYKVAGDFQFGSVLDGNVDFKGYAASAALNFNMNPVNIRGSVAYGSGQHDADGDYKEFLPFVGNIQNYSFIYEYQHRTTAFSPAGLNSPNPSDGHSAGIANTTYANLGVDYNASKEMALSLDGYLFWASKTDAFEKLLGHSVDSSAGWEVDAKLKYALAKNLNYQIDAGYFKEDDFFHDAYGTDTKGTTVLRHMLTLSF